MSLIDPKENTNMGSIKIRRDNVILRVPADQKSYYMGLGYNVISESGEVIEETVPTDMASLQRFYKDAKKKIAELEAEIEELKSPKKAKERKVDIVEPQAIEEEPEPIIEPVQVEKPSRRRKKS